MPDINNLENNFDTNIIFRDLQPTDTFQSTLLLEKNWSKDHKHNIIRILLGGYLNLSEKMSLCHKLKFSNPISSQPDGVFL